MAGYIQLSLLGTNPDLTRDSRALRKFLGLTLDVDDVNRLSVKDSAAGSDSSHERNSRFTDRPDDRDRAVMSDDTQDIAVDAVAQRIDRVTEARRILRDGVEGSIRATCHSSGAVCSLLLSHSDVERGYG